MLIFKVSRPYIIGQSSPSVMVNIVGNGISEPSSNPEWGW